MAALTAFANIYVHAAPPEPPTPSLERRVAEVSDLSDDELVDTARWLGIPDPYGLTRAGLVIRVAAMVR